MNTKKLRNVSIFYLTSKLLNIYVCYCCIKSEIVVIKYNKFFLTVIIENIQNIFCFLSLFMSDCILYNYIFDIYVNSQVMLFQNSGLF